MSRKDNIHEPAKRALIKAGWTITHDPLTLRYGTDTLHIDLGAERNGELIAVEVKDFTSPSPSTDIDKALGQVQRYRAVLKTLAVNRKMYLL